MLGNSSDDDDSVQSDFKPVKQDVKYKPVPQYLPSTSVQAWEESSDLENIQGHHHLQDFQGQPSQGCQQDRNAHSNQTNKLGCRQNDSSLNHSMPLSPIESSNLSPVALETPRYFIYLFCVPFLKYIC